MAHTIRVRMTSAETPYRNKARNGRPASPASPALQAEMQIIEDEVVHPSESLTIPDYDFKSDLDSDPEYEPDGGHPTPFPPGYPDQDPDADESTSG